MINQFAEQISKRSIIYSLFIFCNIIPIISPGQNNPKESIINKIALINSWKSCLDSLSSFDDAELIDSLNQQLKNNLLQILNDKDIVNYKIDTLLHIYVTKSPDDKIMIFSFYENTGGSYQSNVNIIYYRLPNGQPIAKRLTFCKGTVGENDQDEPIDEEDNENRSNYGGGIDSIIILKANGKIKYFGMGGGISCNSCEFFYTFLFSIKDSSMYTDFCLLLDFRQGDGKLTYNQVTGILSYEYYIYKDDTLYGDACKDNEIISDNRCRIRGKYKFNGDTFIEISKNKPK